MSVFAMAHRRSVSQLKNDMVLDRTAKSFKTELLIHSTHSLGLLATLLALFFSNDVSSSKAAQLPGALPREDPVQKPGMPLHSN